MKKLSRITLHNLSQAELAKREQNLLKGGYCSCTCSCGYGCPCKYAGDKEGPDDSFYGGSNFTDNNNANMHNLSAKTSNGATMGSGV